MSDELPLDLPDCFMNGTPYTDCDFKFGRKTGKALKPVRPKPIGASAPRSTRWSELRPRRLPSPRRFWARTRARRLVEGFRDANASDLSFGYGVELPDELARSSSLSFWVELDALPRGYGYALDASRFGTRRQSRGPASGDRGRVRTADRR